MTLRDPGAAASGPHVARVLEVGLADALRQLGVLLQALRQSRFFRPCGLLALGIVAVIGLNMVGQVRLNAWQGDFFNALEQRRLDDLLFQVVVFGLIIACLLTLVVGETWLREILEVRMREWLTRDLLDQWVVGTRPYLLGFAGEIAVNPDQRMQADALQLTELTISLSIGLLRSSLLLVSFLGVLWALSGETAFVLRGEDIRIPGYLVWCALLYALSGSWLTWRVGRPLIGINAERYAREADLRFALVRISENAEAIALHGGAADERRALDRPVDAVVAVTRRLASALARLTWITSGYGWLGLLVPVLVAAPGYFQGSLTFGGLMMAVGAFNHVQAALRWFVENFPAIANWRATLLRVATFRETLPALDLPADRAGHIEYLERDEDTIVFDDLRVALSEDEVIMDQPRVEAGPGDRLLIMGRRGVGKSVMFKALAGIWPWGGGAIHVPPRDTLMFIPQRPYLPLASLRAALTYPSTAGTVPEDAIHGVLERVGLAHLVPRLDDDRRWDQELALEEQQRLTLARVLLRRPRAVFMDEALSTLDADRREFMLAIFEHELANTIVVSLGTGPLEGTFYNRSLRLRRRPRAPELEPAPPPLGWPDRWPGTALAARAATPTRPDPALDVRTGHR
ncbi:MAG TPA: ABC transporter ATP-binding protein/permease [Geminicoccaceae bacterium]